MPGKIIKTFDTDGRVPSDINTENVKEHCNFHHTLEMESIQESEDYTWVSTVWSVIPGSTSGYDVYGGLPDGITMAGSDFTADISGTLTTLDDWHPVKDYLANNPDEPISVDGKNYYQKGSKRWYMDGNTPVRCSFTVIATETATNNGTGLDETFTYTADLYIMVIANFSPEAFLLDYGADNNNLVLPYLDEKRKTRTRKVSPEEYVAEMKAQGHLQADYCN